MIARWKAYAASIVALLVGVGLGRWGLGDVLAATVLLGFVGVLAAGVAHEVRTQRRVDDLDHIDEARAVVARALEGNR